jgi:hypothetical protein
MEILSKAIVILLVIRNIDKKKFCTYSEMAKKVYQLGEKEGWST